MEKQRIILYNDGVQCDGKNWKKLEKITDNVAKENDTEKPAYMREQRDKMIYEQKEFFL